MYKAGPSHGQLGASLARPGTLLISPEVAGKDVLLILILILITSDHDIRSHAQHER